MCHGRATESECAGVISGNAPNACEIRFCNRVRGEPHPLARSPLDGKGQQKWGRDARTASPLGPDSIRWRGGTEIGTEHAQGLTLWPSVHRIHRRERENEAFTL